MQNNGVLVVLSALVVAVLPTPQDEMMAYAQSLEPRFFGQKLQLSRLPIPKLPGVPQVPNLPALLQVLQNVRGQINNPAKGKLSFNTTLYNNLVSVCETLAVASSDFYLYSTPNLCPNMTNLLTQAGGLLSSGVDVGMSAATAALSLLQQKTNCDKGNGDNMVCYAQIAPSGLRTLNILLGLMRQASDSVRQLAQGMLADWDYCMKWEKLPKAQRQAVIEAWKKHDNGTCALRARNILDRKTTDLSQ